LQRQNWPEIIKYSSVFSCYCTYLFICSL